MRVDAPPPPPRGNGRRRSPYRRRPRLRRIIVNLNTLINNTVARGCLKPSLSLVLSTSLSTNLLVDAANNPSARGQIEGLPPLRWPIADAQLIAKTNSFRSSYWSRLSTGNSTIAMAAAAGYRPGLCLWSVVVTQEETNHTYPALTQPADVRSATSLVDG